jgi:hypothetical protein
VTDLALARYLAHTERFGVELVFETAVGLGETEAELTIAELVELARRLDAIDPRFDAVRPDKLVELAGVEIRDAYLERVAPVLDVLAAPTPTSADRCCEWCGKAIAGHAHRKTCSSRCRKRLARADGVGPFTRPGGDFDLSIAPGRNVTLLSRGQGGFEAENRGVRPFREVSPARSEQLRFEGGR